jgi:hypothetical protein
VFGTYWQYSINHVPSIRRALIVDLVVERDLELWRSDRPRAAADPVCARRRSTISRDQPAGWSLRCSTRRG